MSKAINTFDVFDNFMVINKNVKKANETNNASIISVIKVLAASE